MSYKDLENLKMKFILRFIDKLFFDKHDRFWCKTTRKLHDCRLHGKECWTKTCLQKTNGWIGWQ